MHSLKQMTVTFAGGFDCCKLRSLDDVLVLETTKPFSDKLSTASALLLAAATTVSFCNNNNDNESESTHELQTSASPRTQLQGYLQWAGHYMAEAGCSAEERAHITADGGY